MPSTRHPAPLLISLALLLSLMLAHSHAAVGQAPRALTGAVPEVSLIPIVVTPAFDSITDIANAGDERLFIVEKTGAIKILHPDGMVSPFLNITVGFSNYQGGLLGLAFHPDHANNGHFYVHYTNIDGDVRVSRFSVTGNPDQADPGSELTLLAVEMPDGNPENFGGDLAFGPDGMLYVAIGDGYVSSYPPYENDDSQDLSVLPGKILRLDVDAATPYAIPPDNPFVGVPGAREEIWVYGLRNPWRFSFDDVTGDMWIGDVGQDDWEEVNYLPAGDGGGQNFGWPCYEGAALHDNPPPDVCDPPPVSAPPVAQYDHAGHCAVTGGYRYRGAAFPVLQGHYLYADWCSGDVWSLTTDGAGGWQEELLLDAGASLPATFGEDHLGELYVGSSSGALYRVVENTPYGYIYLPQLAVSP
jgi:glucose/arabinose dehydrogenase